MVSLLTILSGKFHKNDVNDLIQLLAHVERYGCNSLSTGLRLSQNVKYKCPEMNSK